MIAQLISAILMILLTIFFWWNTTRLSDKDKFALDKKIGLFVLMVITGTIGVVFLLLFIHSAFPQRLV